MTIYFYKACSAGPCDVEVRILRQSRTFQNVQVTIIQGVGHARDRPYSYFTDLARCTPQRAFNEQLHIY